MLAYEPSSLKYTHLGVRRMKCWVSWNCLELLVMRLRQYTEDFATPREVYEAVEIQVEKQNSNHLLFNSHSLIQTVTRSPITVFSYISL